MIDVYFFLNVKVEYDCKFVENIEYVLLLNVEIILFEEMNLD